MGRYRYRALNSSGVLITGRLDLPSEALVVQHVRRLGYLPISATDVTVHRWKGMFAAGLERRRKPSQRDLSIATQELATLLQAGLSLDRALTIVGSLSETKTLHHPMAAVVKSVCDGSNLSDALSRETAFSKFYVSMVRAGEMGGNLQATLFKLADYLSRANAVREAVLSALVYPVILLITSGLSIFVILVFVLPQFAPLFADAGKSLPLPTQIVMTVGHFLGAYYWLLALMTAGTIIWFRRAMRKTEFKKRVDALLLRLPLFGDLLSKIEIERFSRTLGTLLHNGVSLPAALVITKDALTNRTIADAVAQTAISLREGESLAGRLARAKVFPAMTLDMVRVGEESGKLDEMLLRQADYYERNTKHAIDRLLALLVPVLTIVLGLMVAGLIASILVAILSVNDLAV